MLIDGVFGLRLTEKVVCRACGMETHNIPEHYEHLIVVNSISLHFAAQACGGARRMDQLLAELFNQEQKFCDKDEGGCGEPNVSGLALGPLPRCWAYVQPRSGAVFSLVPGYCGLAAAQL